MNGTHSNLLSPIELALNTSPVLLSRTLIPSPETVSYRFIVNRDTDNEIERSKLEARTVAARILVSLLVMVIEMGDLESIQKSDAVIYEIEHG